MGLTISYHDETSTLESNDFKLVEDILKMAARIEEVTGNPELSITFVNTDRIQAINHQYRMINQPTDVISFAFEETSDEELEIVGADIPRILGDIIISVPIARQQANEYNHSFQRELGFLIVHGFLHLLGYDHQSEQDEKQMFQKQKDILDKYGLRR